MHSIQIYLNRANAMGMYTSPMPLAFFNRKYREACGAVQYTVLHRGKRGHDGVCRCIALAPLHLEEMARAMRWDILDKSVALQF